LHARVVVEPKTEPPRPSGKDLKKKSQIDSKSLAWAIPVPGSLLGCNIIVVDLGLLAFKCLTWGEADASHGITCTLR
jgi:hypothetical protein